MNQTENLSLPQWEADDRIMRTDFNNAMASIDAAVAAKADAADISVAVASCGNCTIVHGSYQGSGTCGSTTPNRLTFTDTPLLVIIFQQSNMAGRNLCPIMIRGTNWTFADTTNNNEKLALTWEDRAVSWYHAAQYPQSLYQLNSANQGYYYIALLEK